MKTSLFVPVVLLASAASAMDRGSPVMPSASSQRNHDAIDWNITMARAFTSLDSIEVTTRLTNGSTSQFTFHTERKSNIVQFELTPRGKEQLTRKLNISLPPEGAIRNPSGNYKPKPKETIWAFQVDLRTLFGKLNAGSYSLLIRYPKSSFELRDTKLEVPGDLVSPSVAFNISKTSLEEAARSIPRMQTVTLSVDEKRGPHGAHIGTLTNHSIEPITFAAYMSAFKDDKPSFTPPLSTIMTGERWHPKHGWQGYPVGFCGTGLGKFTLKSGASVKVYLSAYSSGGDGIYRYRLPYTIGKDKSAVALSDPTLVNNFKEAAE